MKILITGICGYLGSRIASLIAESIPGAQITGIDNLSRRGSETNLRPLIKKGVIILHGDLRLPSDLNAIPGTEWVIDCAANPSVIAGVSSQSGCTSGQLVEHNLSGTLNLLEYCKRHSAGLIMLSTSRVYSVDALRNLPLHEKATRLEIAVPTAAKINGFSQFGISDDFPTTAPVSIYGATKLASEIMALEYGSAFSLPVRINRCGVISGPGQFGKADQGIFSFWVYSYALNRQLKYIGFGGTGKQVRDCVTAEDVADLVIRQIKDPLKKITRLVNVGGGIDGAMSLYEISQVCESYFKRRNSIENSAENRPYDIPYYVTDLRKVHEYWGWRPTKTAENIILDLCDWTSKNIEFVKNLFE